ncbi:uncharacterized protein [Cherax quadricarinatus]
MIVVDDRDPVGELPPPFPPRNIEVKEDVDMRKFYNLKKEIGRGRFGTVYLAEDKSTGQKFAAKFVNTKRNQDRANAEREVEIMKSLNSDSPHPRLIQLYDAYNMTKEMCLVLEIVDGGELFERVIDDDFVLSEKACTVFIRQICEGIEFIHSKNILHLDMKPENILCLSREGNRIKICDFGLARRYDPRKKLQVLFGTPEFVAPEVVNFEPISFGTDMWSVGVITYVLLSGLSPFMGHNYVETMTNVTHNKYDFEDESFKSVSDESKEFIQKLLVLDKSLRLTPAQCLRHDWLRRPPPSTLRYRCLESEGGSEGESEGESEEESEEESESEDSETDNSLTEEKIAKEEKENEKERRRRDNEQIKNIEIKRKELEKQMEEKKKDLEKQMEEKKKDLEKQMEEKKKELEKKAAAIKQEEELERTKKQLKEFVERWNSHPNSPYLVGTPIPLDLQRLVRTGGWNSRASLASFASMAVAPPSDIADLSHLEEDVFTFNDLDAVTNEEALINNVDSQEDFTLYTIEPTAPLTKQPSPEEVAKELEAKLIQLQLEDTTVSSKDTSTGEGIYHNPTTCTTRTKFDDMQEELNEILKLQNTTKNAKNKTVLNDVANNSKDKINKYNEEQAKAKDILNKKEEQRKPNDILINKEKEPLEKVIEVPHKMSAESMEKHKRAYEERKKMKDMDSDQPKGKENNGRSSISNHQDQEKPKSVDRKTMRESKSKISEELPEAEKIINDILRVDHKSAYEEYKRMMAESQMKIDEKKANESVKNNVEKEENKQIPIKTQEKTAYKEDTASKRENSEHKIINITHKKEDQKKQESVKVNVTGRTKNSQESIIRKQITDKRVNGVKKETIEEKQSEEERKKRQEEEMAEHKRLYEEYKRMVYQGKNKEDKISEVTQVHEQQRAADKQAVSVTLTNKSQNKERHRQPNDAIRMLGNQNMNSCSKSDLLPKEPLKRPEIIALQNEELGGVISRQRKKSLSRSEQGGSNRDSTSRGTTSKNSEEREYSPRGSRGSTPTKQLKKQPSRDVPLPVKNTDREDQGATPVLHVSLRVGSLPSATNDNDSLHSIEKQSSVDMMPGSPTRRSRKTSREERPPSRESDRSTRGGTPVSSSHRRPSRDVPLSPAQLERLDASFSLSISDQTFPQSQAWPDIIVGPQGEDSEDLPDYKDSLDIPVATLMKSPSGTLLSVPGVTVSQVNKQALNDPSPPSPNQANDETVAKDEQAYVPNNKLVAWILDIGTKQVQQTSSVSMSDRVNQWESRDSSPRLTPSPSRDRSPRPRELSPLPTGKEREKSPTLARPQPFQPLSREASSDSLFIQTPWGTLKRSPSKSSLSKTQSFEAPSTKIGEMTSTVLGSTDLSSEKSDDSTYTDNATQSRSPKAVGSKLIRQLAVEVTDSQPAHRVSSDIPPKPPERNKETYKSEQEDDRPAVKQENNERKVLIEKIHNDRTEIKQEDNGRTTTVKQNVNRTEINQDNHRTAVKQDDFKSYTLPRSSKLMKQRSSDCLNLYSSDKKQDIKKPPPIDIKKINEDYNTQSLKRKSKFPPSPNQKKKIGPMLFSAQDRIFQFEQKPTFSHPPQQPITRTRSNVVLSLCSEKVSNDVNKNGLRGAKVNDKTQVGYLRTRLLEKVGKSTPTLPEEPGQGEDSISQSTTNNKRNSAGGSGPSHLR